MQSPVFILFFLPSQESCEPTHVSGKIFQRQAIKSQFSFKAGLKRPQTPLEVSLKPERLGEKWRFLNETPVRVICGSKAAPFFAERCAVNNPIDYLSIKLLGMEASASGHFAIAAVVLIAFALLASRSRR